MLWYSMISLIMLGVFLSLRGAAIDNDGFVDVDDIHVGRQNSNSDSNSLLCHTNNRNCCTRDSSVNIRISVSTIESRRGRWFLSNGSVISTDPPVGGYRRNRSIGVVLLYRDLSTRTERGRLRCEIPDALNVTRTLYVNICEFYHNYKSLV